MADHRGRDPAAPGGGGAPGGGEAVAGPFPEGATLRRGRVGWVLAEDRAERALGGALAWALHTGVEELHVLASDATGLLARRAACFTPAPRVWRVEGRVLTPAEPEPVAPEPPLPAEAAAFLPVLAEAGVEAVVEHGTLTGEVLGLEVARVVVDGTGARLEVGVGRHDREGQRLVHGDRPPLEALEAAVAAVRAVRRPDAPAHQVNQLAGERWLRRTLMAHPELVGASRLAPVSPPVPRTDLRQRATAPTAGTDAGGRPVLAVCSTGIDVDLVPAAADVRAMLAAACAPGAAGVAHDPAARLVLFVPEADAHPVTRSLAAALRPPAEVVVAPADWRRLHPPTL